MGIQYKFVGAQDAAILSQYASIFEGKNLSMDWGKKFLQESFCWFLVAYEEETPVGYACAYVLPQWNAEESEVFLYDIEVHSDHQRKGVGSGLIATLRDRAQKEGHTCVWTLTDDRFPGARELYTKTGADPLDSTMFTWEE